MSVIYLSISSVNLFAFVDLLRILVKEPRLRHKFLKRDLLKLGRNTFHVNTNKFSVSNIT